MSRPKFIFIFQYNFGIRKGLYSWVTLGPPNCQERPWTRKALKVTWQRYKIYHSFLIFPLVSVGALAIIVFPHLVWHSSPYRTSPPTSEWMQLASALSCPLTYTPVVAPNGVCDLMLVIILHHSEVVTLCVCGILHKGFPRKKIISFGFYFEKKLSIYPKGSWHRNSGGACGHNSIPCRSTARSHTSMYTRSICQLNLTNKGNAYWY
jgi:hypothetical protein